MCNSRDQIANEIHRGIVMTGGATVVAERCEVHGRTTLTVLAGNSARGGYVIGAGDDNPFQVFSIGQASGVGMAQLLMLVNEMVSNEMIMSWLLSRPFTGLGIWKDPRTNDLTVEGCEWYDDRVVALTLAAGRNQYAIYDLSAGAEVLV